jgi:hypothetical protein
VRPSEISSIVDIANIESLLQFPYPSANGDERFSRYKLFPAADGGMKYYQRAGTKSHLYILESARKSLADPRVPLVFVEGEKKCALAVQHGLNAIGIGGVWSWSDGETGGLIGDFDGIVMVERSIEVVFDSDIWTRSDLQQALYAFGKALEALGAKVQVVVLPGDHVGKIGFDDFVRRDGFDAFAKLPRVNLKNAALA